MKKFIFSFLILISILGCLPTNAACACEEVEVNFFSAKTCPHCAQEALFLEKLQKKYPGLVMNKMEISEQGATDRLIELYEQYHVPDNMRGLIPITFIEEKYFLGYRDEATSGKEIEDYIIGLSDGTNEPCDEQDNEPGVLSSITLPILGQIDTSKLSTLTLATVLGILDGFNACAMAALGFLLTLLISSKTRKRIMLIGGTFILVSGLVYFIFIAAWLNLFMALEQIKIITSVVGIVVILFSIFLLKDHFYGISCKLCEVSPEKENFFSKTQRKLFERMKQLFVSDVPLPMFLLGIGIVAAGINIVELFCSFGFPLAFTKALTNAHLSTPSYYLHIFVYTLFYMLDDFLIFLIVVITLRMTKASDRYLKTIKMLSAIALLILGIAMIFKPELLTF